MYAYVARQPICDSDKNVVAYELLFRDGMKNCYPDIPPDEATSKILTASHLGLGVEEITCGKQAYINFHQDTLLYRFPTSLDPMNVVIEVVETVETTSELLQACKHVRQLGYTLALDDYDFDAKWDPYLEFVQIVKVDIEECDADKMLKGIDALKARKIKLIAERVETEKQFNHYVELGFDYFQGYFLARPQVLKHKNISSSKLSMLELVGVSSSIDFDFDKVNSIIERDVALSYLLLRFINNPLFSKRHRIDSLRHALNYLGELEVKKFIALLALANMGDDKPVELLHLSLVRAKFCELISVARKDSMDPPKGFLLGLFSLLDVLLDQPMQDLVEKVPLTDDVKKALRGESGTLRDYLLMVRAFETGNWPTISKAAKKYGLQQVALQGFYNEAIKWGNAMRNIAAKQH
ncbi:EAL and HDOD domain-containing protein [Aestuariibacter salexigens]|uniref:EAL and HDOD domain-containing protein n=1 Tax=Aestuariibacter salexigens TaxID=226010 RepID=UPI0004117741|nr:EAL domain-containing protein [Aestuariibacter salexigens]